MKKKVQRENGEFFNELNNDDDDAENDAYDEMLAVNVDAGAQNTSESNQQKHAVTLRRNRIAVNRMSMSEALRTLKIVVGSSAAEIRSNCMLAHKQHPDEWHDRCMFTRKESEDAFKIMSNACSVLM